MAKEPIKEKETYIHRLDCEGYLNLEENGIEIEGKGLVEFKELFKRFNGKFAKFSIADKTEEEIS